MNDFLQKSDYEEPRCLLNMHPEVTPVPVGRIIEKLDAYLDRKDYDAAEKHLDYWLNEADAGNDTRGKLTVLNEQIGLYRKTGKEAQCLAAIDSALSLAEAMDMGQTVTAGTTLLNAATGCKAFGKAKEALPLYRKAKTIYESALAPDDKKLAGLYNNMALALTDLREFDEAKALYGKAIGIMEKQKGGAAEAVITRLNLADLITAEKGPEDGEKEAEEQLLEAERLLDSEDLPRDGHYAFVCEKCAPVFGYYGYFLTEKELNRRAKEIYERT